VSSACSAPVPFEELIAYQLCELSESDAERVEAHYFSCAYFSSWLIALFPCWSWWRTLRSVRGVCEQHDGSLQAVVRFFLELG
jgi:hypothetical protein